MYDGSMPNDRAKASILQNIDLKKYPKLRQFLTVQSLSDKKNTPILSNNQALDLLEEAIGEVEGQLSKPTSPANSSRLKEINQAVANDLPELTIDQNSESSNQVVTESAVNQEPPIEQPTSKEQAVSAEAVKSSESAKMAESAEMAEIGQELVEIREDDKEQEEELARKQQAAIDQLASQALTSPKQIKPVVVLPITERQNEEARKKSIHFSLRWLAEWAEKIKKIFSGAVLYKEEVENSADV